MYVYGAVETHKTSYALLALISGGGRGDAITRLLPWQSRLHVLLLPLRGAKSHYCYMEVNQLLYICGFSLCFAV